VCCCFNHICFICSSWRQKNFHWYKVKYLQSHDLLPLISTAKTCISWNIICVLLRNNKQCNHFSQLLINLISLDKFVFLQLIDHNFCHQRITIYDFFFFNSTNCVRRIILEILLEFKFWKYEKYTIQNNLSFNFIHALYTRSKW